MNTRPEPEFSDIQINQDIPITMSAFYWIQVGELLAHYQDEKSSTPYGVKILLERLAEVLMTKHSIKAHEAHRSTSLLDMLAQAQPMFMSGDEDGN